jgi:probable DNA metabolism protein
MTKEWHFLYDGSFDGFLSVVFKIYELKVEPTSISTHGQENQYSLFGDPLTIQTQKDQSDRIKKALEKLSPGIVRLLYRNLLTELPDVELLLYRIIKRFFNEKKDVAKDFSDPDMLRLSQLDKKLFREEHRMHAFVRFQEMQDGLFAATIQPDFNVIPILGPHFIQRYPAFDWLIFDVKRGFGLIYKNRILDYCSLDQNLKKIGVSQLSQEEKNYQSLWKTYYTNVNITARNNEKLHLQHVPRRYWPYLIEK